MLARCYVASLLALLAVPVSAEQLYKYRGENGEWIFADRPPGDGSDVEVRELERTEAAGQLTVEHEFIGAGVELSARNPYYAPAELSLRLTEMVGLILPADVGELRWVVPARSEVTLVQLNPVAGVTRQSLGYEYQHLLGDPNAVHQPRQPYRVPYAIATTYPVSQAYPDAATHTTIDSYYAVDIAMPVGTAVVAAREGVVFEIDADNYKAGLDPERDGPSANVVRILHDDGTMASYAHLNWNSIRVRPGDQVRRGETIAYSGNTGFSTGPHLHFVVQQNTGLRLVSMPVVFMGANYSEVTPQSGMLLTAY